LKKKNKFMKKILRRLLFLTHILFVSKIGFAQTIMKKIFGYVSDAGYLDVLLLHHICKVAMAKTTARLELTFVNELSCICK